MRKLKKEFGQHYIVELIGCDPSRIKFVKDVKKVFVGGAKASGATVIEYYFHQFKPWGVSGIIHIAESHFSIHTWPEEKYAALDILTCGTMDALAGVRAIAKGLKAKKISLQVIPRGF